MTFEHHRQNVVPHHQFVRRLFRSAAMASALIAFSLLIGMVGYHFIGGLPWIDSFENAAMILSGMGPVDEMQTGGAKIFAGSYALFSGIVFLSIVVILIAPIAHRLLHKFHVPTEEDEEEDERKGAPKEKPRRK